MTPHPETCPCQRCEAWRAAPFQASALERPAPAVATAATVIYNPPPRSARPSVRMELARRIEDLGDDEVRVLLYLADRLHMGAGQYGPLDIATDPRDWTAEARAEFADGAVYLAIRGLREAMR